MTDIFAKYAALRQKYPEDTKQIEVEEKRVTALLKQKEFYSLPTTTALLDLCRNDVLMARVKLATDRTLIANEAAQRELWALVDARLWFIERVAQNYDAELKAIDMELEAELAE